MPVYSKKLAHDPFNTVALDSLSNFFGYRHTQSGLTMLRRNKIRNKFSILYLFPGF